VVSFAGAAVFTACLFPFFLSESGEPLDDDSLAFTAGRAGASVDSTFRSALAGGTGLPPEEEEEEEAFLPDRFSTGAGQSFSSCLGNSELDDDFAA
jgi:hypothetical protein